MEDQKDPLVTSNDGLGSVRIADEVVSVIAGLAAMDVEGVAGMSGGLIGGIADLLGRKNFSKGVKVEVGEREAAVDLSIVITYGADIREVATNVQKNVRQAIESMSGLKVVETNVTVQGVAFPNESSDDASDEDHVRVH
ncbi:Asp23/Gls24 family envelope stress response protein [Selenomonas sp. TAMA-11512]|uniref:Asp23/Gls24 family envelope stress response protein n=1 Tax=Selenomonas sp. TAMA-11512 TaxID=3095337 RepID=UPI0030923D49|nr:Asp23/Gls24 family envelope stress response protein [Selenomonas sp. TAMA-11512]